MKSESFWQGIVIQTLGTLAAATIVALIAIFSGVGYPPAIRYFVIFGFTIILYVGVTVILGVTFHIRINDRVSDRTPRLLRILARLSGVIVGFIMGLILSVILPIIRFVIASWTGYTPS